MYILIGVLAFFVLVAMAFFTITTFSKGLKINGVTTKISLTSALLAPLLFFAGFLINKSAHWTTPFFYTIIQIIIGTGFYLFIGAVALGIVLVFGYIARIPLPTTFISFGALTLSILLIVIGIFQARIITVTNYTVTLKNAPASWEGKKAVLVSDTHFGFVNREKFSNRVANKIIAQNPDLVLHAGDFYDGPTITLPPITESWKKITTAAPVFYAPGNHEEYGESYENFITSIYDAGVTVLEDRATDFDGVQIAGIKYRGDANNPEVSTAIKSLNLSPEKPTILINHPPTGLLAAKEMGVALQVSGHTHNGQLWPGNLITKKVYGVYTYGLHLFDETLQVLTTRGVGTNGPPMRTFNQAEIVVITFKTE